MCPAAWTMTSPHSTAASKSWNTGSTFETRRGAEAVATYEAARHLRRRMRPRGVHASRDIRFRSGDRRLASGSWLASGSRQDGHGDTRERLPHLDEGAAVVGDEGRLSASHVVVELQSDRLLPVLAMTTREGR